MDERALLDIILSNTYTRSDFQHRIKLLQEFLEFRLFQIHANSNLLVLLNEFINLKKESRDEFSALNFWNLKDFFESFHQNNLYSILKNVVDQEKKLPYVVVYLPFLPPIYEIPKLGRWLRSNIKPNIMLDIKHDPKLIGGCALVYRGAYRDFSLRYYLEKSKKTIKKVINEYLEKPADQAIVT